MDCALSYYPTLTSEEADIWASNSDIVYGITRLIFIGNVVVTICLMLHLIYNKRHYHQSQEIFWPLRCHHCFRVLVNQRDRASCTSPCNYSCESKSSEHSTTHLSEDATLPPRPENPGTSVARRHFPKTEEAPGYLSISVSDGSLGDSHREEPSPCVPASANSSCSLLHATTRQRGSVKIPNVEESLINDHHQSLFVKPHKSLLNAFLVFSVIAICNVPFVVVADVMCLTSCSNRTKTKSLSLLTQAVIYLTCTSALLVAMVFFNTYHDAVFIQAPKTLYKISYVFAGCICMSLFQVLTPMRVLSDSFHPSDHPCKLNGTFGKFTSYNKTIMVPFNTECGIIAAGILWQMWSNILPRDELKREDTPTVIDIFAKSSNFLTRLKAKLICSMRIRFSRKNVGKEQRKLLPKRDFEIKVRPLLNKIFTCLITVCIAYFSLRQYIVWETKGLTYVVWCLEMGISIPLAGLLFFQSRITTKGRIFEVKEGVSLFSGLESHDKILVLASAGIFVIGIFHFSGAVGLLFRASSIEHDRLIFASLAVFYALFQVSFIWIMTLFLLIVQRQSIHGFVQTKWTLICLLYSIVLNVTQWLSSSLEIESWQFLADAYGKTTGMAISVTLEPVVSLYGLHAALVAYETYRDIYSESVMSEAEASANDEGTH